MSEPVRIGICTDQNLPWKTLVQRWKLSEQLGIDSGWDCDHLFQPSRPHGPYFEAGPYWLGWPQSQVRSGSAFWSHATRSGIRLFWLRRL